MFLYARLLRVRISLLAEILDLLTGKKNINFSVLKEKLFWNISLQNVKVMRNDSILECSERALSIVLML